LGACSWDEMGYPGVQPLPDPSHASGCRLTTVSQLGVRLAKSWCFLHFIRAAQASSREARHPSCKFQSANAAAREVKCRIFVLDSKYHAQADSRIAVLCVLENEFLGATRDWPVRCRPWRLCKHSRRAGTAWRASWLQSPAPMMDLQMGRELVVNFLFVPAAGSCSEDAVRSLNGEFPASPEQTTFKHLMFLQKTCLQEQVPQAGIADPRQTSTNF
jgi:hypothetical protein